MPGGPSHLPKTKQRELPATEESRQGLAVSRSSVPPFSPPPTLTNKNKMYPCPLEKESRIGSSVQVDSFQTKVFLWGRRWQNSENRRNSPVAKTWGRPSEGTHPSIHPSTLPGVLTSPRESGNWKCSLSDSVLPLQRKTNTHTLTLKPTSFHNWKEEFKSEPSLIYNCLFGAEVWFWFFVFETVSLYDPQSYSSLCTQAGLQLTAVYFTLLGTGNAGMIASWLEVRSGRATTGSPYCTQANLKHILLLHQHP